MTPHPEPVGVYAFLKRLAGPRAAAVLAPIAYAVMVLVTLYCLFEPAVGFDYLTR